MDMARTELLHLLMKLPGLNEEPGRKAFLNFAGYPYIGLYLDWSGTQEQFARALLNELSWRGQRFTSHFLKNVANASYMDEQRRNELETLQQMIEMLPADGWAREFPSASSSAEDSHLPDVDLDMLTATVVSSLLLPFYELGNAELARTVDEDSAQIAAQIAQRVEESLATQADASSTLAAFKAEPGQNEAALLKTLRLALNQDEALAAELASMLGPRGVLENERIQPVAEVSQNIRTVKGDVVGVLVGERVLQRIRVHQQSDLVDEGGTVAGLAVSRTGTSDSQTERDETAAASVVGNMDVTQQVGTVVGDLVAGNKIIIINPPSSEPGKPRLQIEFSTLQIRAGKSLMGSEPGPEVSTHETPAFTVELPAFKISRSPVSNREYARYLRHTGQVAPPELRWEKGTSPSPAQEELPVCGVSLKEALGYCEWLSQHSDHYCTLPSEVQWECAARLAGSELGMIDGIREWTTTVWGEQRRMPDPNSRYPWQPNPYVWEPGDARDDLTLNDELRRVTRGGTSRLTKRGSERPVNRGLAGSGIGFRIVVNSEE